ncbi:IPMK family protein [Megaselia abdita]
MIKSNGQEKPLPNGIIPFHAQVAGHIYEPGTKTIGILQDRKDDSVIYKSFGKPACGIRETKFYMSLEEEAEVEVDEDCQPQRQYEDEEKREILKELKSFIPSFYGHVKFNFNGSEYDFLKLENLTRGIQLPCVMDIKIGQRTYDPLADEEKIKSEESKYYECKKGLGFCIPGFQVYDLANKETKKYSKNFGKKLTPETMPNALKYFLNIQNNESNKVHVLLILKQLYKIQKWCQKQKYFELFCSSILIIYDASILNNNLLKPNDEWVHVKMIDFAHVFPIEDKSRHDTNYIFGINNLVQMFESFV